MKADTHPKTYEVTITCSCGAAYPNHSTKKNIAVEICSNCHPFFTGKQRLIDTAGRVERFIQKYKKYSKDTK